MRKYGFEEALKAYKKGIRIKPITGEEDEKWWHIDDAEPLRLTKIIYLLENIWEIEKVDNNPDKVDKDCKEG